MVVAVQLLVAGLYRPPVLVVSDVTKSYPPHTIISLPVHTATLPVRASGALRTLVAVHLFVLGLYRPPVLSPAPPQTIISVPVQTTLWLSRAVGALVILVAVQLSVSGWYLPPVFKSIPSLAPPHRIISVPVHTAF